MRLQGAVVDLMGELLQREPCPKRSFGSGITFPRSIASTSARGIAVSEPRLHMKRTLTVPSVLFPQ
jgi:hypothetical protein